MAQYEISLGEALWGEASTHRSSGEVGSSLYFLTEEQQKRWLRRTGRGGFSEPAEELPTFR